MGCILTTLTIGAVIGAAGGTLIMGLVFGRLGRVGPLVTTLSHSAASALSNFGMLAFLAYLPGCAPGDRSPRR